MQIINLKGKGKRLLLASAFIPTLALADEACIAKGGLAWNNWTKVDAGGSGSLPPGETEKDYLRCKSCHGWDQMGVDGGYVRRSRKASRPNAGAGDGDTTSRSIDTGVFGQHTAITADMILHVGNGRSLAEGSGSWVEQSEDRTASNTAAHQNGYTLGNQHPDYSGLLTDEQVNCLAEFLNAPDTRPDKVFKRVAPTTNPVAYQLVDSADATAGKVFYEAHCATCHAAPDDEQTNTIARAPEGGFIAYLNKDGKPSELAHASRWGIPGTTMTRSAMGNPGAQDIANLLKYMQSFAPVSSLASGQFLHEEPLSGSVHSGVSTLRGWACDAELIEMTIDGGARLRVPSQGDRGDTADVCGDSNNGYGLAINWGLLTPGEHALVVYADNSPIYQGNFTTVRISPDIPFLEGLKADFDLSDFPAAGQSTTIEWSEAEQNFIVTGAGSSAKE